MSNLFIRTVCVLCTQAPLYDCHASMSLIPNTLICGTLQKRKYRVSGLQCTNRGRTIKILKMNYYILNVRLVRTATVA